MPQRILVIERDSRDRESIRRALSEASLFIELIEAGTLQEGLKVLQEHTYAFDCALVDWADGDIETISVLEYMRENLALMPVIIMTTQDDAALASRAAELGAQDYLHKLEINAKTLPRAIRYAVERRQIRQEIAETRAQLDELHTRDPLTKLLNRRGLEDALQGLVKSLSLDDHEVYGLLLDLDDFNSLNERFGYVTGDIVLKTIAQNLSRTMRGSDFLGRVGRDEFLVLLPRTRLSEALKVADRLRLLVGDIPILLPEGQLRMTASVGVAPLTSRTVSISELLFGTGQALNHAKKGGKNRTAVQTTHNDGSRDLGIEEIVNQLCQGHGLRTVKQAIVRLSDEAIVGYEILTRGPQGPFEAPYDFFRLCTEQRVLNLVDLRCAQACVEASKAQGLTGRLHVNLFPSTILDTPAAQLAELFPRDLPGLDFCVELSEQQIIGEPTDLNAQIELLRGARVSLALDDVGFGRSSLESLVVLEPEVVKIDRKWVTGAARDPARRRVLERIIKMARALDAQLVAEGIEQREDLVLARELGIEFGQGYFWGKPA